MGATACVSKTSAEQNWQSGKRTLTFDASILRLCLQDMYQSHMCTVINGLTTRRGVGDGAKNMDGHDSKYLKQRKILFWPAATSAEQTLQLIYSVFSLVKAKLIYGEVIRKSASLSLSKYSSSFA